MSSPSRRPSSQRLARLASASSMAIREQSQHQKKTNALRRKLGTLRRSLSGKKLGWNNPYTKVNSPPASSSPRNSVGSSSSPGNRKARVPPKPEKSCSQTIEAELSADESEKQREKGESQQCDGTDSTKAPDPPASSASVKKRQPPEARPESSNFKSLLSKPEVRELERVRRAAEALDRAGNDLFDRGLFDAAMASYTRALKLKRRMLNLMANKGNIESYQQVLLGSVATSINNIGYLRQRNGANTEETMAAYQDSLQIKREILGDDHLGVGKTLNNIGSVYFSERMYDQALGAYKEALQIIEKNLGKEHLDVATVHSNIGDVYLATRKTNEARHHYKEALSMRWHLGEHHPKCIRLMEKIASIEMVDIDINLFRATLERGVSVEGLSGVPPIETALHTLHDEVERDIAHVATVERELALDMIRDKLSMIRGMRELMGDLSSPSHIRPIHPAAVSSTDLEPLIETSGGRDSPETCTEGGRTKTPKAPTTPVKRTASRSSTPTRPLTPMERTQALQSVKSRLSRIRNERGLGDSGRSVISSTRHGSASPKRPDLNTTGSAHSSSSSLLEEGMEALRSMELGPPNNLAPKLNAAVASTPVST